jgi:hypothetical protein
MHVSTLDCLICHHCLSHCVPGRAIFRLDTGSDYLLLQLEDASGRAHLAKAGPPNPGTDYHPAGGRAGNHDPHPIDGEMRQVGSVTYCRLYDGLLAAQLYHNMRHSILTDQA